MGHTRKAAAETLPQSLVAEVELLLYGNFVDT